MAMMLRRLAGCQPMAVDEGRAAHEGLRKLAAAASAAGQLTALLGSGAARQRLVRRRAKREARSKCKSSSN